MAICPSLRKDSRGILDIVVIKSQTKNMDTFVVSGFKKVVVMPDFDLNGRLEGQNRQASPVNGDVTPDEDLIMERILENLNTTPVGQVLKRIASLPEIRRKKVLRVRRQLTEGKYNLNDRLEIALDKVLEDFTA